MTIDIIENDRNLINLAPKCEPQLGRRGLYTAIGGDKDAPARSLAMLWVLNFSGGRHSLPDIVERAGSRLQRSARLPNCFRRMRCLPKARKRVYDSQLIGI